MKYKGHYRVAERRGWSGMGRKTVASNKGGSTKS